MHANLVRKRIHETPMLTYAERLGLFLVECASISIHTLCMRVAKTLASLHICADSPETSFLDNVILEMNSNGIMNSSGLLQS